MDQPLKNLITRTLTGAVFVSLTIGSLILHPYAFTAVIFALMVTGLLEIFRLSEINGIHPGKMLLIMTGSAIFLVVALISLGLIKAVYLAAIPLLFFVFYIAELWRDRPNALQNIAFSTMAVTFIALPLSMLVSLVSPALTSGQPHWHFAFSFFIISWSHDTFAYLTGMLIGKHKLFERISPKKTWEGTIGGTLFGLAAAFILSLSFTELGTWQWLGAAMVVIVTGTFGDLAESMLKRNFHVKDSGTLFPGHGGVLDRFDSVLFAAPALFFYLLLLN